MTKKCLTPPTVSPWPCLHYMGHLHLVLTSLNLSILNAGILKKVQHGSLMMFSLIMVDFPLPFLSLYTRNFVGWISRGDHFE